MKACNSKKNKCCIILLVISLFFTSVAVSADVANSTNDSWRNDETIIDYPDLKYEELSEQEKIIWKYYDTVNLRDKAHPDGDWETRASLTDVSQRECRKSFSENSKNRSLHMGIFNLKSCQIVYIEKIDNAPADVKEKDGLTFETYIVGMLCDVYEDEDLFTFDGVNFDEVLVCWRETGWYILENRGVSTEQLKTIENSLLTADAISFSELNRMNASTFNPLQNRPELAGLYENTNISIAKTSMEYSDGEAIVLGSEAPMGNCHSNAQPSNIYVWIRKNNTVSIVDFDTYIKRVLQNEIGYSYSSISGYVSGITQSEYMEGLKANAMAVKMFAWWFRTIHPKHKNEGVHLCNANCCQVYSPSTNVQSYVSNAIDAVCNVGIRTNTGSILLAAYRDGDSWMSAEEASTGILYQRGTYYLAAQGNTYQDILSYYYANVPMEIPPHYTSFPNCISRGPLNFFTAIH